MYFCSEITLIFAVTVIPTLVFFRGSEGLVLAVAVAISNLLAATSVWVGTIISIST